MTEAGRDYASWFARDPGVIEFPNIEGPPLTHELLDAAQQVLGVELPASYVAMMSQVNGGYLARPGVVLTERTTSSFSDEVTMDEIMGIAPASGVEHERYGTGHGILLTPYMTKEWDLPEGLVLLAGDGRTWIALDYRNSGPTGPPSVIWLDLEREDDLQLAPSFEEFLDRIRFPDET